MVVEVVIVLVVAVVVVALVYAAHSGLFHRVRVTTGAPPIGKFTGAYKFFQGPYKNSGKTFQAVTEICPKRKCFAVWYDDPDTVPPEKLRWITGAILAEGEDKPDPETVKLLEDRGYKMQVFPRIGRAVRTSFPNANTLSIILAVGRVYNALANYINKRGLKAGPFIDIYDRVSAVSHFIAPLDSHEQFYVSET